MPFKSSVHTIITHVDPHLDDLLAISLLKLYGGRLFPDIHRATVKYVPAGSPAAETHSAADWERLGIIYVGVGDGRFDAHSAHRVTNSAETSAELVAKALGIALSLTVCGILARAAQQSVLDDAIGIV